MPLQKSNVTVPWKLYATTASECLLAFAIATFCLAMYFTHLNGSWMITRILVVVLYLFIIAFCIKRTAQRFSLATLMLLIPIAPLVPLVFILLLIPILQFFR